jgi:hypothetical protein
MHTRQGFVLVTALLVAATLLMIGVGASFMSLEDQASIDGIRLSATARAQADAGLDAALSALNRDFDAWPTWYRAERADSAVPTAEGLDYTVTIATVDGGAVTTAAPHVPVVVTSRSVVGTAEASVEMVVAPGATSLEDNPLFRLGVATNASVKLGGNSAVHVDLWAGDSVVATGGRSTMDPGLRAIYHSGSTCDVGGMGATAADPCLVGPSPNVPPFSFAAQRAAVLSGLGAADPPTCAFVPPARYLSCATYPAGTGSSATVTANLANTVVFLKPGSSVTFSGTLDNVVVVGDATTTATLSGANPAVGPRRAVNQTTVVAGRVNPNADVSNVVPVGTTSVGSGFFAKYDVTFGKAIYGTESRAETLIATEGSITLNGNGGRDIYASMWANGTLNVKGNTGDLFIYGSLLAQGQITANGGIDNLRSAAGGVKNPYIPKVTVAMTPTVISRR